MVYKILAFILGFTCFIVQMVLLREFMSLFMGNELVIAIILGLWMLSTAIGAWMGKRLSASTESYIPMFSSLLLCGVSPLLGVFLTIWLRSQLYLPGAMISLQGTILLSLAGLLVFCLISGIMFTLLASSLSKTQGRRAIVKIYAIEALGSLAGGLVFNFILLYTLDSMQILLVLLFINFLAATLFAILLKRKLYIALGLLLLISAIAGSFSVDMEKAILSLLFHGRQIVKSTNTPFGKLVATQDSGQSDIYLNGRILVSSGDIAGREEKVHYAMSLHDDPGRILMLFGGLDGSPAEVCKYQPSALDYVDQDTWSIEYADHLQISEWPEGINLFSTDPQVFLQETLFSYDVILYNGPSPTSIGNNRYYTREFIHTIRSHLNPGGIFATRLPNTGNYLGEEMKMLYSSIHNTLKSEFGYIRIIPGNNIYMLASDIPLEGDIAQNISDRGIINEYVNPYYLDDKLIATRAQQIEQQLDENASVNTVTRPVAALITIMRWLGLQQIPIIPLILIPLILMGIIIFMMSRYNIGLFTTGFTASSAEFLMLIAFQAIYGFIYQMAGLIIMIFMAGLFAGSGFVFKLFKTNRKSFILVQAIMGLLCLIIPVLVQYPGTGMVPGILIGALTFALATFTGIQYQLASHLRQGSIEKVASSTYGADLAGSAFGVFFMGVFVFPALGIMHTAMILALLNITVASMISLKRS